MESKVKYRAGNGHTWATVARRLESCSRGSGTSILTISVIVCNGKPIHWTRPNVTMVEPASKADKFVALLTGEA